MMHLALVVHNIIGDNMNKIKEMLKLKKTYVLASIVVGGIGNLFADKLPADTISVISQVLLSISTVF